MAPKAAMRWHGNFDELRNYENIPADTLRHMMAYIVEGRKPGHFLRACFSNDLQGAFSHGDLHNLRALWAIVTWIYNRAPATCRGTSTTVAQWGGLREFFVGDAATTQMFIDEWVKEALKDTVLAL